MGDNIIERVATALATAHGFEEYCRLEMYEVMARAALEASLPFLSQTGGWRDISTAPKDGTVIIVYRPDAGVFCAHFTNSYEQDDADFTGEPCWFALGGEDLTSDMPTHWMPLPTPPSRPSNEAGE